MPTRWLPVLALGAILALTAACDDDDRPGEPGEPGEEAAETLTVYTTVTEDTVEAVGDAFEAEHPDVDLEVFRAPTGEFNARVAAERRDDDLRADVFWLTDPLSMQQFEADGLLREWEPDGLEAIPDAFRAETFWGTRLLNLVIVHGEDVDQPPQSWTDLADPDAGVAALPDPGFAGSAFGALAYFALEPEFGLEYYEQLAEAGTVQVQAPGDVVTGVAEGRYASGMTLDKIARDAIDDGSPVTMVWPEPGAIAVDSPIAVLDRADPPEPAEQFVEFVLTQQAQEAIASTGWQPVRDDVDWPHETGPTVHPDWQEAFDRQDELLEEYRAAFDV